jgi:hypothetical protein
MDTHSSPPTIDLASFVGLAKREGISDDSLVTLLRRKGWSERRIYSVLSSYYGEMLGAVPPRSGGSGENARDAFYYLLNFITLAFWTTALGRIFYVLIARSFPDPVFHVYFSGSLMDQIAWQLAAVVIAFPVFVFLDRLIERNLRRHPGLADSPVRAWLTYVALVGAALVVLADGIWFVESFLRGQLSTSFILDSLVLLVLGGGVFAYYLVGLRRDPEAV